MKTVKVGEEIRRVSDAVAQTLVQSQKALYVPKSVWKKNVRDVDNK